MAVYSKIRDAMDDPHFNLILNKWLMDRSAGSFQTSLYAQKRALRNKLPRGLTLENKVYPQKDTQTSVISPTFYSANRHTQK